MARGNVVLLISASLVFISCMVALFPYLSTRTNKAKVFSIGLKGFQRTPNFIIGILSANGNRALRNAQRQTWISTLKQDLPLAVEYKFVLDRPTQEALDEHDRERDIVFLNSSYSGYAVKFGEKLFGWFKYVAEHNHEATIVAKMDDDVFLCTKQMIARLNELKHTRLYYGWQHQKGIVRIDEMFVVLGIDLVMRISQRRICSAKESECEKSELVDTNWGGTSLGRWLSAYDDVITVPDNANIIHYHRGQKPSLDIRKEDNFCQKYLLYHKASIADMFHLFKTTHKRSELTRAKRLLSQF
ncbi:hypothetical protein CHS0354_016219 [Potamilus streckersoni]|uniref:Hexosyltransferase n=1 Tax=Potamilus streckersoni TaxID=2493646 RepID=A0AAE0RXG7_9BIVA|nr:hypothetical protein CHS0354_016219 [Potamilus streckersoni]